MLTPLTHPQQDSESGQKPWVIKWLNGSLETVGIIPKIGWITPASDRVTDEAYIAEIRDGTSALEIREDEQLNGETRYGLASPL